MEGQPAGHDAHDHQEIRANSSVSVIVVTVSTSDNCESVGIAELGNSKEERTSNLEEKALKASNPDEVKSDVCVIDVKVDEVEKGGISSKDLDKERVCRICHLSSEHHNASEVIDIGCECKDDLGSAHRYCAEAWFKIKGNKYCEICSKPAKNITGIADTGFLEEWNVGEANRVVAPTERVSCWRGQRFCNFLMGCLILAFILPWFFRVNVFP